MFGGSIRGFESEAKAKTRQLAAAQMRLMSEVWQLHAKMQMGSEVSRFSFNKAFVSVTQGKGTTSPCERRRLFCRRAARWNVVGKCQSAGLGQALLQIQQQGESLPTAATLEGSFNPALTS